MPTKERAATAAAAAYKDKQEQVLRIAASDVAAVAGFHQWVDVRELFLERLLYQDLDHLLRLDAANVGAEVEDKRQRSERLLSKAGNGELNAVRKRAGDGAAVDTVKDAQALREKARSLLKDAEVKKKLSKEEAKELENDLLKDINTQFGTRNENFALDVYERRCGTEVICSNERILVWPFPGSKISGDDGVPDGALDPPAELSQGWTKRESQRGSGRSSSAAEPALPASAPPELAGQSRKGQGQFISSTRCSDGPADDAAAGSADSTGNGSGVKRPAEGKREESSPGFAARSRRGSCLPQKAIPPPATIMTESMADGDDATARGEQEECRRGSMAATLPPAVTMAQTEDKRSSMTSSSTSGGSTAVASEGSNFGSIYSANGTTPPPQPAAAAAAAAAATVAAATAPGATKTKAGLMNLKTFGGDAVYAWGEGPAEPSEPREEDAAAAEEEEPEEEEWSVWTRDTEAVSPPPSEVGPQDAGNGSAAGMEEESARSAAGWGSKTMRERRKEACFVVVGAVDGVAEEVTDAPENAESWETRRVVVEVKNRMYRATNPPPLYDQIQLVTYMLMIGASVGDLVQFVKTSAGRRNGKRGVPRKEAPTAVSATADNVLVSRVELDCRTYRHRKHWGQVVLPRLYEFARMVYRFRGDDLLRWRYLLATPEEQRDMLVECCPYLDSVILRAPPAAAAAAAAVPPSLPSPTPGAPKTGRKATGLDGGAAVSGSASVDILGSAPGASAPGAAEAERKSGNGNAPKGSSSSSSSSSSGSSGTAEGGRAAGAESGGGHDEKVQQNLAEAESMGSSSGNGNGSTVTVLSQKSRRGEGFLEPLGDVAEAVAAAAAVTSPARKKTKAEPATASVAQGVAL